MTEQHPLPELVQPLLDSRSVQTVLEQVLHVLNQAHISRHPDLDWAWTDGTKIYGWVLQHIKNLSASNQYDWLKMISPRMDFVFSLHNIPIQFSKDSINNPSKKHRLLMNKAEYEQYSLFSENIPEQDVKWRVMVEKSFDDEEQSPSWIIALVGFNVYNSIIAMQSINSNIAVPVQSTSDNLPQAKPIDKPGVMRRKVDEQKDNDAV